MTAVKSWRMGADNDDSSEKPRAVAAPFWSTPVGIALAVLCIVIAVAMVCLGAVALYYLRDKTESAPPTPSTVTVTATPSSAPASATGADGLFLSTDAGDVRDRRQRD
jgi:hypothetical protein